MATSTNLGLYLPTREDYISVTRDITNSMQTIDDAVGGLMDGIAIVTNGDTHAAISTGQFVFVRNHSTLSTGLYTANSNIAANATLTSSNLTADSGGGLNALNSKIALVPSASTYTTLDSIKSFLEGINATLADNEYKEVRINTGSPTNISPFEGYGYYTGTLTRYNSTTFVCALVSLTGSTVTINKAGTSWNIDSLSSNLSNLIGVYPLPKSDFVTWFTIYKGTNRWHFVPLLGASRKTISIVSCTVGGQSIPCTLNARLDGGIIVVTTWTDGDIDNAVLTLSIS